MEPPSGSRYTSDTLLLGSLISGGFVEFYETQSFPLFVSPLSEHASPSISSQRRRSSFYVFGKFVIQVLERRDGFLTFPILEILLVTGAISCIATSAL